jgi:transcriptional regulator with XRE-family HTH domain
MTAVVVLRQTFAKNLRRIRLERGLSQEALADLTGIDRTYVSALERELYSPSLDMMERLANALNIPVDQLIGSHDSSGADANEPPSAPPSGDN